MDRGEARGITVASSCLGLGKGDTSQWPNLPPVPTKAIPRKRHHLRPWASSQDNQQKKKIRALWAQAIGQTVLKEQKLMAALKTCFHFSTFHSFLLASTSQFVIAVPSVFLEHTYHQSHPKENKSVVNTKKF